MNAGIVPTKDGIPGAGGESELESGMPPSQVRERILKDHAEIRARLAELRSLIARVERGDRKAARPLLRRGKAFLEFFLAHIELENGILVPALRDTDAWGEERAERVLQEHREQAAEATALIEALSEPFEAALEIAEAIEEFTAVLEADMVAEEGASLSPDLLRDDPVGINVEAG